MKLFMTMAVLMIATVSIVAISEASGKKVEKVKRITISHDYDGDILYWGGF